MYIYIKIYIYIYIYIQTHMHDLSAILFKYSHSKAIYWLVSYIPATN